MGLDFFGVTLAADIQVFSGDDPKDDAEAERADLGVAGIPFTGKDGKGLRYDLWLESSSDVRVPRALRTLSYVQDISVELGMGLNSKVQLVLAPPWEDALVLLGSPLIQWGVGRLNVRFGYSTGTGQTESFTFGGILQKPDVRIGNDITITLNALGIGYALKLAEGSQAETFLPEDTPASVVKKVLKNYPGISLTNIYDDFPAADQNKDTGHAFFKPIFQDTPFGPDQRVIERGPRNDWWFVWEIVRSYGLELLIIDNDFRVKHPERWRGEKKVSKRFRLRAGVNPTPTEGRPIFPILSLSSPTESVWLATGVGRQVMKDIGEDKADKGAVIVNDKIEGNAKDELEKSEGSTKKKRRKRKATNEEIAERLLKKATDFIEAKNNRVAKENSAWGTTRKGRLRAGPLSAASNTPGNPKSTLLEHAKGMFARHNHMKGIHIDVQTIGIPDLRPGEIVKVDGFAVEGQKEGIFDGLYGVIEVRHKVGLGGFMTVFKAISDFYPRAFQLAYQASGTKTTGKIPEDTEDKRGPVIVDEGRILVESIDDFDVDLIRDITSDDS